MGKSSGEDRIAISPQSDTDDLEIVYVPIDEIIPYDENPKLHSEKDVDKLIESMTVVKGRIIFHQPIVLDKDNVIIAGHGRRLAAIKLGLKNVPCTYADVSKQEAIALRLADNNAIGKDYDLIKLEQELDKLNKQQKNHLSFDLTDIDKMLEAIPATKTKSTSNTIKQKEIMDFDEDEEEDDIDLDEYLDDEIDDHPKEKRLETVLCEGLSQEMDGVTEVKTPIGYIDIMTDTQIIEVKRVRKWKWALGQILVYGLYHPDHEKRIHLFGRCKESKLQTIKDHCEKFGVVVTWQYEEFRP